MNNDLRKSNAIKNIAVSLLFQVVSISCGLIVPRLILATFGAELYGATSSITNFLSYVTLLEGGIGAVAGAALYKPLADNDLETISAILGEMKRFFRVVGSIFVVYVLLLAAGFKSISHLEAYDWLSSFLLVLVISISTFAQYFIGISYSIIILSAQKTYVVYSITMATIALNALATVILIRLGASLITVKLVTSCIYVARPVLFRRYVRRHYALPPAAGGSNYLEQKWTGLGQHIAYFLHMNTDIAILTLFTDLLTVSVYAVYSLIVTSVQSIAMSFTTGAEALFGNLLSTGEREELDRSFRYYDLLISVTAVFLFSVTAVMVKPFILLYVKDVEGANYDQPLFGLLLTLASALYCLRLPYHALVKAAGHFRQTKFAAYGEAAVNICVSVLAVFRFGLIGVAVGTILAMLFRFVYYILYLARHILYRPAAASWLRLLVNAACFAAVYLAGSRVLARFVIGSYWQWALVSALVALLSLACVLPVNALLYREDFRRFAQAFLHKLRR